MSNEENAHQVTGESAGSQLRRGREQKGMSVSEVADAQHLRPAVIQAIENGDYQQIDSELFLKGYVRAYAKQVGLDADALVATLDQELEPLRQQRAEALEANPLVDIERRKHQKRRTARVLFLLLVMAAIAALAFSYLNESTQDTSADRTEAGSSGSESVTEPESEVPTEPEPASEPTADAATEAAPDAEPAEAAEAERETDAADGEAGATEESATASATDEPEELDQTRIPVVTSSPEPALSEGSRTGDAPGSGQLQITFSNDCWIEVTDATGARLVSSLQRQGDRIDVSGQVPLNVVIGAVNAVADIRFQGEAVELSDYRVVNNRTQFTLEI